MLGGINVVWSKINQAWIVCWYDTVLRLFTDKGEMEEYLDSLERKGI